MEKDKNKKWKQKQKKKEKTEIKKAIHFNISIQTFFRVLSGQKIASILAKTEKYCCCLFIFQSSSKILCLLHSKESRSKERGIEFAYTFNCNIFELLRNQILCKNDSKHTAEIKYDTLIGENCASLFINFVCLNKKCVSGSPTLQ